MGAFLRAVACLTQALFALLGGVLKAPSPSRARSRCAEMRALLLLAMLTSTAQALPEQVRFLPLNENQEVPFALHSEEGNEPQQRVTRVAWKRWLAGRKANLSRRRDLLIAELDSGKKIWFKAEQTELASLHAEALPEKRQNQGDYWWNDLLEDYRELEVLLELRDDTATAMTFRVNYPPRSVYDHYPEILARTGLFVERQADHPGVYQLQTGELQEETPGLFNPPYRRYRYLINISKEPSEGPAEISVRATVVSWQKIRNSSGFYSWQPDESPGIRQRIRQSMAEMLTLLTFPDRWLQKLDDYESGLSL